MIDVVMPQMGESIVEGTLTKWLKKPGERVERDEPLFEISTDKVDTEIPSPAAGVLQDVLVEEGQTVGINTVVARIAEEGGAAAAPAVEQHRCREPPPPPASSRRPQQAPAPRTAASTASRKLLRRRRQATEEQQGPLSPVVRKMAREHNIDLRQVRGTGAGGRITKADVEGYMHRRDAQPGRSRRHRAPPAAPALPRSISPPPRSASDAVAANRPRRASSR